MCEDRRVGRTIGDGRGGHLNMELKPERQMLHLKVAGVRGWGDLGRIEVWRGTAQNRERGSV